MSAEITTPEELDTLPVGSVVLDGVGRASQRYRGDSPKCWFRTNCDFPGRTADRVLRYGPARVIHRPDTDLTPINVTFEQVETMTRAMFMASFEGSSEIMASVVEAPCAHDGRCCTEHDTHSMPHVGCILR